MAGQLLLNGQQGIVDGLNQAKPWWAPKTQWHQDAEHRLSDLQREVNALKNRCNSFRRTSETFNINKEMMDKSLATHPQAILLLLGILLGPMGVVAALLHILSRWLFDVLFARAGLKPRNPRLE